MSPVRLIHSTAFDPETVKLLTAAYEAACVAAHDAAPATKELFARRIIQAAHRGERVVGKLRDFALAGLSDIADAG
jgi:hypothetical protein